MKNISYVYFAPHSTEPRFKIGKSINPLNRLQEVASSNEHDIDINKTFAAKVNSEEDAFRIESMFHKALSFGKYPAELCGEAGKTEWFHINVYPNALNIAKSIGEYVGFTLVEDWGTSLINNSDAVLEVENLTERVRLLIEKQRIYNNLTQKEMAAKMNVSLRGYVNFIKCKGTSKERLSEIKILQSLGLGAPINELLTKQEEHSGLVAITRKRVRHPPAT